MAVPFQVLAPATDHIRRWFPAAFDIGPFVGTAVAADPATGRRPADDRSGSSTGGPAKLTGSVKEAWSKV